MSQAAIADYAPDTREDTITRTVVVKLRSNQRKRRRVRDVIEDWQAMAGHFADLLPSVHPAKWGDTHQNWVSEMARREFPTSDIDLRAHERDQALFKVSEAYGSWRERGQPGRRPQTFGDGDYIRLCNCGVNIERHNDGWGIELRIEPRDSEWFQAVVGEYQRQYLRAVTDGEGKAGSAELHFRNGELYAHLTISTPVEVYEPGDISRWVGVDLGERALYAAALIDTAGVQQVEIESGRRFRHTRDRLDRKRSNAQEQGRAERISHERQRYTEQVTHRASREIVKLAARNAPAGIRYEDLTHYRKTAVDPIHDWPFAMLQRKIAYKATEEGIPVEAVNPRDSSVTCRKCGETAPAFRREDQWRCLECGYQVHADVNAAINIARGGVK